MNDTEYIRQVNSFRLQKHQRWQFGPFCLTKAMYTNKAVYSFVLALGAADFQFSFHWHS